VNDTTMTVVGNLVDTPQRRVLDNGTSVTTFRVASTARRFDREKSTWIDRDTLFVRVTCWRQLGDNAARSLIKGDPVVVHGRYFSRQYEVEEQKRTAYDLEAYTIGHDRPVLRGGRAGPPARRGGDRRRELTHDGFGGGRRG